VSRPLALTALLAYALVGLAPVACMLLRVGPDDLAGVLSPRTQALLGRTLLLGVSAAGIATLLGLPFGFLVARTDVPAAPLWRVLGILPMLVPPLILAMSWAGMSAVRGGAATIAVLGLSTFPIVGLYSARAFERVDARREEAALLIGGLRAVLRMEGPLVLPSVACAACFAFVFAVNDFAVPDYVSSIGPKFNVYADEVFASWRSDQQVGGAVAAALPLVALTLMALVPALELRRRNPLATFDGDFRRPARLALGLWRWPALVFVLLVLALAALAPLGRLVWESGGGSSGFSATRMQASFGRALELGRGNLRTSLLVSTGAALACVPVALVLGHALERLRRGTWAAQLLVIVPLCVPAILFGIGNIALWNRPLTGTLYDSSWMVVVLLIGRFAALAILASSAAVAMLDPAIEDAGRLAGAGPTRRLTRLVAPPLVRALLGGALLVFVLGMRELDAAILVPAANGTILFRLYNAVHFGRDDFVAALALLTVFFVTVPGLLWALLGRGKLEVLP
jgi:iron(III) transport system permease protein